MDGLSISPYPASSWEILWIAEISMIIATSQQSWASHDHPLPPVKPGNQGNQGNQLRHQGLIKGAPPCSIFSFDILHSFEVYPLHRIGVDLLWRPGPGLYNPGMTRRQLHNCLTFWVKPSCFPQKQRIFLCKTHPLIQETLEVSSLASPASVALPDSGQL